MTLMVEIEIKNSNVSERLDDTKVLIINEPSDFPWLQNGFTQKKKRPPLLL